jgi:tripartite-type tricarboxylate transporter receptor subunit TctC
LAATVCGVIPALAHGQAYPVKPVFIVVPYSAGGGFDVFFRAVGQAMSPGLGQQVQIDNRAGANGIIGAEYVVKSAPDGYTVLATSDSAVINSVLYSKLPYDLLKDLTAVTTLGMNPGHVLLAHPSVPVNNIGELIALAKAKPGQLTYASFGVGSSYHLAMELFQSLAGIKLNHIPYKGTAPAIADVAAGHVQFMFSSINSALPYTKANKLRMLAVSMPKRSPLYPDLPTFEESGVPGLVTSSWYGLNAPAGTPRVAIDRLSAEARKGVSTPAFRAKFLEPQGLEEFWRTPEQFSDLLKEQLGKWGKVVKEANIKLD